MTDAGENRRKLKEVLRLLRRAYGRRRWPGPRDPVGILVATILSQNTGGSNSSAGFANLKRRFASWRQVADGRLDAIEKCIRVSGLSRVKAPRIRSILRKILAERGRISLAFLRRRTPAEAISYLTRFNGVGPKTACCVLLFALGMKVFPVDTHIRRIAVRLGLLKGRTSAEAAHAVLGPLIAPGDRYEMHVLLIEHGRRTCLARRPRCRQCGILPLCPHGRVELQEAAKA